SGWPPPRRAACRPGAARSRVGGLPDGRRQPRLAPIRLAAGASPRLLLLGLALQLPDDLPLAIAVGLALQPVVDERKRDVGFEEVGRRGDYLLEHLARPVGLAELEAQRADLIGGGGLSRPQRRRFLEARHRLPVRVVLLQPHAQAEAGVEVVGVGLELAAELLGGTPQVAEVHERDRKSVV